MTSDILTYLEAKVKALGYDTYTALGQDVTQMQEYIQPTREMVYISYNQLSSSNSYVSGFYEYRTEMLDVYYILYKDHDKTALELANELYEKLQFIYTDDTFGKRVIRPVNMSPVKMDTQYITFEIKIEVN